MKYATHLSSHSSRAQRMMMRLMAVEYPKSSLRRTGYLGLAKPSPKKSRPVRKSLISWSRARVGALDGQVPGSAIYSGSRAGVFKHRCSPLNELHYGHQYRYNCSSPCGPSRTAFACFSVTSICSCCNFVPCLALRALTQNGDTIQRFRGARSGRYPAWMDSQSEPDARRDIVRGDLALKGKSVYVRE